MTARQVIKKTVLLGLLAAVGCGQSPSQQTKDEPFVAAPAGEVDKIREALKNAGIANPPVAVFDGGNEWVVTIAVDGAGPNGEPPRGTRPIPERARIDKVTYKVTRDNPNGRQVARPAAPGVDG